MESNQPSAILIAVKTLSSGGFVLDHLHQKAVQTLASIDSVILSSFGPADIQTSHVSSVSDDLILYVFLPRSSDHLLNLEHRREVVVTTESWDLQGIAQLLNRDEVVMVTEVFDQKICLNHSGATKNRTWGCILEIRPTRLTFHSTSGQGNIETIDF